MTLVKFVLIAIALLMLVTFWMGYFWPWVKRQYVLWEAEIDLRMRSARAGFDAETQRMINEATEKFRRARKEDRL